MIKFRDLMNWAKDNAMASSLNEPDGYISGDAIAGLAKKIKAHEPFDYNPPRKNNKREDRNDNTIVT